jgi:predicted ribosomally synthesized peptide with SipW-like signal peptide
MDNKDNKDNKDSKTRKLLLTALVIGVIAVLASLGTFAAFTDTTNNTGNQIQSGTVAIDQHAGFTTLYNVTNQKPGDSTSRCVRVSYTGTLAATVKLYTPSTVTNGSLYNLRIERGSGLTTLDGTMSCAGFTFVADVYPTGTLGNFASTYNSYANGLDAKGSAWAQGNSVDYRFTITQNDDATAGAHRTVTGSGTHTFTWEARNN